MDSLDWKSEAQAVVKDISSCVSSAELASDQINTSKGFDSRIAYINVETKEKEKITVKLDVEGFCVVGRGQFDDKSLESQSNQKYETIYALLNNLSPSYTLTFAQNLTDKLTQLANGRNSQNGK